MYTFALVNMDIRLPDLQGWYLVVKDADTFTEMHGAVTKAAYLRYNIDPHLSGDAGHPGRAESFEGQMYNPVNLGAKWFDTASKYFFKCGTIFVNQNGGIVPKSEKIKVLKTVVKTTLEFPKSVMAEKDEWITISAWPDGKHFYISSRRRVFSPEKFDTMDEARKEALKYTDEKHIEILKEKENKKLLPKREGD